MSAILVPSFNGKVDLFVLEGEVEEYGVAEVAKLLLSASKMKHIKESGMNFDSRMRYVKSSSSNVPHSTVE